MARRGVERTAFLVFPVVFLVYECVRARPACAFFSDGTFAFTETLLKSFSPL